MCIAAFIWQAHPLYEFLLLQNRDEYHNRPTKSVSWWEDSDILGGRDELAGGTWLACTREGRLAFLTNVLELHIHPEAKSRGDLPVRFLESKKSPMEFAKEVGKEADQYNGFNLIVADLSSKTMVYVSNRPKGQLATIEVVSPGIHVLSNARLDSPWPKVEHLGGNFKHLLGKYGEGEVPVEQMVEDLMRDTIKADESRLPHICSTEWELELSSVFVEVDTQLGRYGTRSTAALSLTANGEVSFYETYLEDETWKEQTVSFQIIKKFMDPHRLSDFLTGFATRAYLVPGPATFIQTQITYEFSGYGAAHPPVSSPYRGSYIIRVRDHRCVILLGLDSLMPYLSSLMPSSVRIASGYSRCGGFEISRDRFTMGSTREAQMVALMWDDQIVALFIPCRVPTAIEAYDRWYRFGLPS
ncbi:hypothetical protein NE237_022178 [Protea cynaroides]|uniref:Uncharacterized protein n=1 Tax=Protea cynaroides TaxID=273540 RepID=A0A9Q0K398_9MAGN|nr:hypothetical protein NE237_022178 [Protea cynaroides]